MQKKHLNRMSGRSGDCPKTRERVFDEARQTAAWKEGWGVGARGYADMTAIPPRFMLLVGRVIGGRGSTNLGASPRDTHRCTEDEAEPSKHSDA